MRKCYKWKNGERRKKRGNEGKDGKMRDTFHAICNTHSQNRFNQFLPPCCARLSGPLSFSFHSAIWQNVSQIQRKSQGFDKMSARFSEDLVILTKWHISATRDAFWVVILEKKEKRSLHQFNIQYSILYIGNRTKLGSKATPMEQGCGKQVLSPFKSRVKVLPLPVSIRRWRANSSGV